MADIARIAGVSESAVSRALHDSPRVSAATRERIKKIAADLDFEFNSHARSLSTSRSRTIAVIIPDFGDDARRAYYLNLLVGDIRSELKRSGYDLMLADSGREDSGQSNLRRLVLQKKVDGLVLVIADLDDLDRRMLEKCGMPAVVVNSKPLAMAETPLDEFPCFFTDNLEGGRLAAARLVERGCERLLCLADEVAGPEMLDRTSGFAAETARHGLVPSLMRTASDFDSTYATVTRNLGKFRDADGVFCHTDVMACATLRALRDGGIAVPGDVGVIGYDDIELGTYFSPRLTTIHQPREEISRLACAELLARIDAPGSGTPTHVSVPPSLVVRESG